MALTALQSGRVYRHAPRRQRRNPLLKLLLLWRRRSAA